MQDNKPLYSQRHPGWGFRFKYNWINKVLDYIYLLFSRPKLTQSNLENASRIKLSSENIDKAIRNLKSDYIRKTVDCHGCGKRIKKEEVFYFRYPYHADCLLKKS